MTAAPRTTQTRIQQRPIDTLTERYAALFVPQVPHRVSRMNGPHARGKYTDIPGPLSPRQIAAHVAGIATYAVSLIEQDGMARMIAADVDTGGIEPLQRLLAEAQRRGVVMLGITSANDEQGHDGGHVWAFFDAPFVPERGRQLIKDIAAATGVSIEAYPSRQPLRLAGGMHRWTQQRGVVLFQDGSQIDLDSGPDAMVLLVATVEALPRNSTALLPHPETPQPVRAATPTQRVQTTPDRDIIKQFNQQTNLISFVENGGGKIAERRGDGSVVMHCPCGRHSHGDKRASLEIKRASNARYGQYIIVGYAPNCQLYTEQGRVIDPFGAYCILERLTAQEAVKRLAPPQQPHTRSAPPLPEAPPIPTLSPADKARREREREQRRNDARATLADVRARLAADTELTARARAVMNAMLDIARDRDWCRPSIARLMEATGLKERTVQRGLSELKERRYIEDDPGTAKGGYSTAIRRFLRVSAEESENAEVAPVLINKLDLNSEVKLTSERPPDTAPPPDIPSEPVIAFEGGASYTPVPDVPTPQPERREWRHNVRPKDYYVLFHADRERQAEHARIDAAYIPPEPEPEPEQTRLMDAPPSSPVPVAGLPQPAKRQKRRTRQQHSDDLQVIEQRYHAAMAAANKAKNPFQARAIRDAAAKYREQLVARPRPLEALAEALPPVSSQPEDVARAPSQVPPAVIDEHATIQQYHPYRPVAANFVANRRRRVSVGSDRREH